MKLDDAIRAALQYEDGVHKVYLDAMNKTSDEPAKRIFRVLCQEEAEHLNYLQERLFEWEKAGKIEVKPLGTAIPEKKAINKGLEEKSDKTLILGSFLFAFFTQPARLGYFKLLNHRPGSTSQ